MTSIRIAAGLLLALGLVSCVTAQQLREAEAHSTLGLAYLNENDPEGALDEFFKAEKALPRDPEIQHRIALAFFAKGFPEEAEKRFKKAISLSKEPSPEAHVNLSALYLSMDNWEAAEIEARNALAVPTYREAGRAWNNLAYASIKLGKLDQAEEAYQRILGPAPAFCPAWHGLSIVAEQRKDLRQAIVDVERASLCDPNNLRYIFDRGRILNELNRVDEARPLLERVQAEDNGGRLKKLAEDLLRSMP